MAINIDKKIIKFMNGCGFNNDGQCTKKCVRCKKALCDKCFLKPSRKCSTKCQDVIEYRNNLIIFDNIIKK